MKHLIIWTTSAFLVLAFSSCAQRQDTPGSGLQNQNQLLDMEKDGLSIVTLGGGCFWCVEAVYQELKGVYKVESGYTGGSLDNPSYKQICSGTTGHAEVVQIFFDSSEISFEDILEVFWSTHDPTTLNRQGNDVGTQYRSVIFYHDEDQRSKAEYSKREIAPQLWERPIVTEIAPMGTYYPAENYHQDYYRQNTSDGYCSAIITPKMVKFRKRFKDKLK